MLERAKRLAQAAQQLPGVRTGIAVQKRYGADEAGILASAITYSAFLSVFPLLLVALSAVGYVLGRDPETQREVLDRIAESIPGLQTVAGDNLQALIENRRATGIVGLAGLLWSGTAIVRTAGHAVTRIFGIEEYSNFFRQNLWAVTSLVALGTISLVSIGAAAALGGVTASGVGGIALGAGIVVATVVLDVITMLLSYRILAQRHGPAVRAILPGAVLAGIGWSALKLAGAWYAARTLGNAQAVYGTFAATVGLLVIFSLGARLFLYGAELAMVLTGGEPQKTAEAPPRAA